MTRFAKGDKIIEMEASLNQLGQFNLVIIINLMRIGDLPNTLYEVVPNMFGFVFLPKYQNPTGRAGGKPELSCGVLGSIL